MSIAEIAERGRQEAAKLVDRVSRPPSGGLNNCAPPSGEASAAFELFRNAAPRRFFPGVENGAAADVLRTDAPAACQDILAAADAICARRFDVLGYEALSFGDPVDWHRDPVTERRAPSVHWSRIDPLDPLAVGDAKVIWELNRHQWLIPLAQAYWLTHDRTYAQRIADIVDDWSRANPYGQGINWSSSLEVAFRIISWTWAFVLLRDASVLSAREFSGLVALVRTHAQHIERYLSRYFSPNTHLTGEALGLFYIGTLFPELRDAARWRSLGKQILIDESSRQIHPDGVYFEQATCYHRYTIEIYLHFLILAARNEVAVPPIVSKRLERMLDFLLSVAGPDGTMPQIGDADGGWLLPLARRAPDDCRGIFATAAAFFDRDDFACAAHGPAPEVLWLLGPPAWRRVIALQSRMPRPQSSRLFQDGGYAVLRAGAAHETHQLIVDVGPLGCPISAAHGHADLLSIQCMAFGERYIVDPGTYCYTAEPQWRNHFRSTSAHSTVIIDHADQVQPVGPFTWKTHVTARVRSWESTTSFDCIDASHDGYTRLPDPVVHRRRVLFVKPRYWIVVDDLEGRDHHDVAVRFQFTERPVRRGPDHWIAAAGKRGEGLWMAPFAPVRLECDLRNGVTEPIEGWLSTHYGRRTPATAVVFSAWLHLPMRIATVLFPVRRLGATPPRVEAVCDASGQLTGLLVGEPEEFVRFTDEAIVLDRRAEAAAAALLG
jgi:hypothetical protein